MATIVEEGHERIAVEDHVESADKTARAVLTGIGTSWDEFD